jgi:hypothetical protein
VSAIHTVLWPGMHELEPTSKLGGILAYKRGYHAPREWLQTHGYTSDYSYTQFAVDREGPADEPSAIDWTFPGTAIAKYAKRLLAAGRAGRGGDPRTLYMREFFGQADIDSEVEGWDFAKNRTSTSDSSHLWHIHISVHRKYVMDPTAMRAILSILSGQPLDEWRRDQMRDLQFQHVDASLPVLKYGDADGQFGNSQTQWIHRVQRLLGVPDDGDYGQVTKAAVLALGIPDRNGAVVDMPVWEKLCGLWGAADRLGG